MNDEGPETVNKNLIFLFYIQSSSLVSFLFLSFSLSFSLHASYFSATPTKLFRFFFLLISLSLIGSPCFSWKSSLSIPGAWELLLLLLPRLRVHFLLPFQLTFLLFFLHIFISFLLIIPFTICGHIEYSFVSTIPIARAMEYFTQLSDYVFDSLFTSKSGVVLVG